MTTRTWISRAPIAALSLTLSLTLGACASLKPKPSPQTAIAPQTAAAPAPVARLAAKPAPATAPPPSARTGCVPKTLPRAPRYPDTDAALRDAGGAADRYQLLAAGRLLREGRLADLERVVEACR